MDLYLRVQQHCHCDLGRTEKLGIGGVLKCLQVDQAITRQKWL